MAILEKEVWVGLMGGNATHFESLGYIVPRYINRHNKLTIKRGTKILVKTDDLPENSKERVTKICDECGKYVTEQPYYAISASRKITGKDTCSECAQKVRANNRKNNVKYENSMEYWVRENNKEYLLSEFSSKNIKKPNQISYGSNCSVWWKCNKCEGEYLASVSNRTIISRNCPFCSGKKVLHGFNDLWTTHPDVAKLLTNIEVGYEISYGSNKKVEFTCPNCGKIDKKSVTNVVYKGLSCSRCSDGISYPEKFFTNVLDQLTINYKKQQEFDWSKNIIHSNEKLNGNKRYDFYIPSLNMIIETHGGQHFVRGFQSFGGKELIEEQENDKLKEQLAKNNGITEYISVDCQQSNIEFIKNNIVSSKMSYYFNLDNIDWLKCHENACVTLVKTVCELWNKGIMNTLKISKILKLNRSTVTEYLKKGSTLGWCSYNPREEIIKSNGNNGRKSTKQIVQLTKNNEYIRNWNSITEAQNNMNLKGSTISMVCNGRYHSAGGFKWMFKEDYEKNKDSLKTYEFHHYRSTSVVQLDLNDNLINEFPSMTQAAESLGIGVNGISQTCMGKRKVSYGFKWMYKEDYDKQNNLVNC